MAVTGNAFHAKCGQIASHFVKDDSGVCNRRFSVWCSQVCLAHSCVMMDGLCIGWDVVTLDQHAHLVVTINTTQSAEKEEGVIFYILIIENLPVFMQLWSPNMKACHASR